MAKKRKSAARRANMARHGATSASQYGMAQAVLSGLSKLMPRKVAAELVDRTPAKKRDAFARELAARRSNSGERFKACVSEVKARGGAYSPRGVCASAGRAKYGAKKFAAMAQAGKRVAARHRQPTRRRNQEDTAVAGARKMFKKFTGRDATRVDTVEQLRVLPDALSDCGRLVELTVLPGGQARRLTWPSNGGVRVGVTHDGGQLYFIKGDQVPDLSKFPGIRLPKDHLNLGELAQIVYFTSKDFHNFEPSEYEHKFAENGGRRPTLHYDVHSKRLYLTGGTYRVKRAGIVG